MKNKNVACYASNTTPYETGVSSSYVKPGSEAIGKKIFWVGLTTIVWN